LEIGGDRNGISKKEGCSMSNLIAKEYNSFEAIKHVSEDGDEFWYARELAPVLEYVQWRNFAHTAEDGLRR
jgi:hypothetical protein